MFKKLLLVAFSSILMMSASSTLTYSKPLKRKEKLPKELVEQIIKDNDLDVLLYDQYKENIKSKISKISVVKEQDLNGDHKSEYFVLTKNQVLCGSGGCELWIYHKEANKYQALHPIDNESVFLYDLNADSLKVTKTSTNGYADLECFVGSNVSYSGVEKVTLKFNGTRYIRTVSP